MIKVQNVHLSKLLSLYAKLLQADFPSTKDALDHIKRSNAIEQAFKITESAREAIIKKHKLDGVNKEDEDANKKANEAYTKVLLEEVELDLVPFSEEIILSINLKPIEILMLKDLNLTKIMEGANDNH